MSRSERTRKRRKDTREGRILNALKNGVRVAKGGKNARAVARTIQENVRRFRTPELIISHGMGEVFIDRPISFTGLLRIMRESPEAVKGDGSRRRAAELRHGLGMYRRWMAGFGAVDEVFATYLFDGDDYPAFDWNDLHIPSLAYKPPPLTTDYTKTRESSVRDDFGWSDDGGRKRPQIQALVDGFGKHRRWQDLVAEKSPNHKLTEEKVIEIRERYAAGGVSQACLAKEYGVTQASINNIVWGSTWIYTPGPVKCRQVMRARCTQDARYNIYGERTKTEEHPRPEILNDTERDELDRLERQREDERYVSRSEITAWSGNLPVQYEWGRYVPVRAKLRLESSQSVDAVDPIGETVTDGPRA